MDFCSTVTTPINTSADSPKETLFKLTKGLVYKIEVFFPPGPQGLVGVRILEKNVQLYPVERTEWFVGDNMTIQFEDTYYLFLPSFEWTIQSYNTDTAWEHTVQVRLGLMTEQEYVARYAPLAGHEALQGTLDNLAEAMGNQYKTTGESPLEVFEPLPPEEMGENGC